MKFDLNIHIAYNIAWTYLNFPVWPQLRTMNRFEDILSPLWAFVRNIMLYIKLTTFIPRKLPFSSAHRFRLCNATYLVEANWCKKEEFLSFCNSLDGQFALHTVMKKHKLKTKNQIKENIARYLLSTKCIKSFKVMQ